MSIQVLDTGNVYLGSAEPSSGGGQTINNEDIRVTVNGVYSADDGYTGLGDVTVDVPLGETTIGSNGVYPASNYDLQGFSQVTVDVPTPDNVNAKNATGSSVAEGDKVWLEKKTSDGTRNCSLSNGTYLSLDNTTQIVTFTAAGSENWSGIYKSYAAAYPTPASSAQIVMQAKIKAGRYGQYSLPGKLSHVSFCGSSTTLTNGGRYVSNPLIKINAIGQASNENYGGLVVTINFSNITPSVGSITLIPLSSMQYNAWYWVKVVIGQVSIKLYWSTDGQNWNQYGMTYQWTGGNTFHQQCASKSQCYSVNPFVNSGGDYNYGGTIDLSETFVKVDDEYWWRPYLDSVVGWNIMPSSMMSVNSFSGIATENMAVSETGDVKTVLPNDMTVSVTADADNAQISAE